MSCIFSFVARANGDSFIFGDNCSFFGPGLVLAPSSIEVPESAFLVQIFTGDALKANDAAWDLESRIIVSNQRDDQSARRVALRVKCLVHQINHASHALGNALLQLQLVFAGKHRRQLCEASPFILQQHAQSLVGG